MAHPIDLKAKAVAALAANQGNVYRTAKQLGVSRATISKWASKAETEPTFAVEVAAKKRDLADMCEDLARKLCAAMLTDERIEAAKYGELNSGYGTSIDKMRLLREQPTSIQATAGDGAFTEMVKEYAAKFNLTIPEAKARIAGNLTNPAAIAALDAAFPPLTSEKEQ